MRFNVADKIAHRRQETGYSCGAAAVAMLLGQPEKLIRPLVNCNRDGTHNHDVLSFLKKYFTCHYVHLHADYYDAIEKLTSLSLKYPFYCSATYLWKNPGPGRPITRYHASVFADGYIYDPAEPREIETVAYESTFNKKLTINSIIIVEAERPNFLKNFKRFGDDA